MKITIIEAKKIAEEILYEAERGRYEAAAKNLEGWKQYPYMKNLTEDDLKLISICKQIEMTPFELINLLIETGWLSDYHES